MNRADTDYDISFEFYYLSWVLFFLALSYEIFQNQIPDKEWIFPSPNTF